MPHAKQANYIHSSPWDHPKKKLSRWITIIELYRELFKRQKIPDDKQYWSLCGNHIRDNKPIEGELGYLLKYDFVNRDQYYGIDREKYVIKKNREYYPDINWICDDFYEAIKKAIINKYFNAEIINYDGVMQPKNSVHYLKKIMSLLDHNFEGELMLNSNFVLSNPYNPSMKLRYKIECVLDRLKEIYLMPDHWQLYYESYIYTHSQANMGILIFVKERHDINNIQYSKNRKIGN